jgi:hypothetical protein
MKPSAAQHLAACLALCERLEREPATQAELDAAALALRLNQRWPPVQQELLQAA